MSESRTVTRAIRLPVKYPRDKAEQPAFFEPFDNALRLAVRVANLAQAEHWRATVEHCKDAERPGPRRGNGYQVATRSEPGAQLGAKVVSGIERWVWDRWRGKNSRGKKVWASALAGTQAIPSFRSVPLPIDAQDTWQSKAHRPHLGRGGEPFVWLPLGRDDDGKLQWTEVPLKHRASRGDRRAYHTFCAIVDGRYKGRTMELYRQANGRLMIKFVVTMPVADRDDRAADLMVATRPDSLWVASHRGRPTDWRMNALHVREMLGRKAWRDQRLREDAKAETIRRPGRGPRARIGRETVKHRNRVGTELHRLAKQLVAYAERRGLARVVYDDRDRGFAEQFPWADLAARVEQKCEAAGIEFVTFEDRRAQLAKAKAAEELARLDLYLTNLKGDVDESAGKDE